MSSIGALPIQPVTPVRNHAPPPEPVRPQDSKAATPPSDPHGPAVVLGGTLTRPPRPPEKPADPQGDPPRDQARAEPRKPPRHVDRVV